MSGTGRRGTHQPSGDTHHPLSIRVRRFANLRAGAVGAGLTTRKRGARRSVVLLLLGVTGVLSACLTAFDVADLMGNLDVVTATTGPDPDPDGYLVTVNDTLSVSIASEGTVTVTGLLEGEHSITVADVARNCTVDQTSQTVTVVAAGTTTSRFGITCVPLTGDIEVTVNTGGPDPDPDGYVVTVDDTLSLPVPNTGTVTFAELLVGEHMIEVSSVAGNCSADPIAQTVHVAAWSTSAATVAITCVPLTGNLEVSVTTTGPNPDTDGYLVTVDGTLSLSVESVGMARFADLLVGNHTVAVTDVAANCSAELSSRTVAVPAWDTTHVTATITCVALTGDLEITVMTSGPDPDPDGYVVTVDDSLHAAVSTAGTVSFAGLLIGEHTITVTDIAGNCVVDSPTYTATVTAWSTTSTGVAITCVPLTGALEVTVETSGADPDPDGYLVTVDGTLSLAVGSSGTVTFTDLLVGDHTFALTDIAANCTANPTTQTVGVVAWSTTTTSVGITCVPLIGDLEVTVTTSGPDPDPDGYLVTVDDTLSLTVASAGAVTFPGLLAGNHAVVVTDIAGNCMADLDAQTVSVEAWSTTEANVTITCVPLTGRIEVTVMTTGPDPDPDGFVVTVDDTLHLFVASTGTVTFSDLLVGDHSVVLSNVAGNCTANQGTQTVGVAAWSTTSTSISIACVPLTGHLQLTVTTNGPDPDPDGYLATVDDTLSLPVATTGIVTFAGLLVGDHSVAVTDIEGNCTANLATQIVSVAAWTTTVASVAITCVPLRGDVEVTVTTGGPDPDPDGYLVTVDDTLSLAAPSNGTVTFSGLLVGNHTVVVTDIAGNCTADLATQTVTVAAWSTTPTSVAITCVPLTGDVEVTVTTGGPDPDPDGYLVTVDDTLSLPVPSSGTVTFSGLLVGNHSVVVTDIAGNCTADVATQTVSVAAWSTTPANVTITCVPLTGDVEVTVTTGGSDPDPDGYLVTVDDTLSLPIASNGTVTFAGLLVGDHTVALTDIAGNCTADLASQTVGVAAWSTTIASVAITCVPLTGDIEVTVTTTGPDPDPDGYLVTVDDTLSLPIASDGTVTFAGLLVGDHTVVLSDLAGNCTADLATQTVGVTAWSTTPAAVTVTCVPLTGDLEVTVTTSGPDPDPDGYLVTVDDTLSLPVASDGTVTFTELLVGDYEVVITDIVGNCTADESSQTVSIQAWNTTNTSFTITCPPILVGAGDIARCSAQTDEATADLLDGIVGTVFTTGDNVYLDGTQQEFEDCYDPSWGRHKSRTRPSAGNHDYNTSGASGYYGYFGAAAGDPNEGYYSYDLESWHIVVLNSNIERSRSSSQIAWLEDDLAASSAECTLAYWHHPRFSSGTHGNNASMSTMWEVLYDAGVEIVLNGHDHSYERFAPQDPYADPDPSNGIRQFVVGTGGITLRGFATVEPNSEVRDDTAHGVLKLTLRDGAYDWEFIAVSGASFTDSGTGSCH